MTAHHMNLDAAHRLGGELTWRKDYPRSKYDADEGVLCLELHLINTREDRTLDIRVIPLSNIFSEYGGSVPGAEQGQ